MASDWLTMFYLGADNDLFPFGESLLDELELVGSSGAVAIVAQRDPTDAQGLSERGPVLRGRWDKEEIGVTAGNAQAVLDFVKYVKEEFPADKKILVLWDHGNGWQDVHVFQQVTNLPPELQAVALGEAFEGADIHVLCFDACLNAMIEIAYQLRRRVKYMVASENVVPAATGWPYVQILSMLATQPQMSAEQAARTIVGAFEGAYKGTNDPVTLSALDLDYAEATVEAIAGLSRALIAACTNGDGPQILVARRRSQSFGNPDYVDLVSFCGEIERLLPETAAARAAETVRAHVGKMVIAIARGDAPSISGANGVSIYFPDRDISSQYDQLDFPHRSGWARFLDMVTPEIKPRKVITIRANGRVPTEAPRGKFPRNKARSGKQAKPHLRHNERHADGPRSPARH